MKVEGPINDLVRLLKLLSTEVTWKNKRSLYDTNKHAEYIFIPILNEFYGGVFRNVNEIKSNHAMIDLLNDSERISVQVTSSLTKRKIKETIKNKNATIISASPP